ncbi:Longitudinals lacking protein, isoforms A/B/D/L [Harpegnathos saltator]|uniref:Longitudinals lacking protein, isoforms A/B/D/L n=2 Tax=Harpegnathos saltator TaxID=610380 RepID=E2BJA6_HARSA|nr:Longitudinals lacking protein, isoforms A/B/D/L [Harpegnathos saltator]
MRKRQRGIYICTNPNCTRSFNWKGNLTRHLRYECGLSPRFKCPYCEYCCKVKGDVSKHIIRKHKDSAVYVLDIFKNPWYTNGTEMDGPQS